MYFGDSGGMVIPWVAAGVVLKARHWAAVYGIVAVVVAFVVVVEMRHEDKAA